MANVSKQVRHGDEFSENLAALTILNEEFDQESSESESRESIDNWEELFIDLEASLVQESQTQLAANLDDFWLDFTVPLGNCKYRGKSELEPLNIAGDALINLIGTTGTGLAARLFEDDTRSLKFWVNTNIHSYTDFANWAIAYFSHNCNQTQEAHDLIATIPENRLTRTLIELIQTHSCLVIIDQLDAQLDTANQQEFWLDFLQGWHTINQNTVNQNTVNQEPDQNAENQELGHNLKPEHLTIIPAQIVVISREPLEFTPPVKSLKLAESLNEIEAADLLIDMGVQGDRQDLETFGQLVEGNLLALTLAANLLKTEEQIPQIRNLVRYGNIFDLSKPRLITAQNVFDRSFKRLLPKLRHLLISVSINIQPFNFEAARAQALGNAGDEIDLADLQKLESLGLIRGLGQNYFYCEPQITELILVSDSKPYHEQAIKYLWTQTKPYFEWESDRDVSSYLEIFVHCLKLGEHYRAFYLIHDDNTEQCVDRYLQAQGKHFRRISLFKPLLKAWQQQQSQRPELGIVLMGLGDAYSSLDKYDRAIAFYRAWLQILIKRNDPFERRAKAQCLYKLAHTAFTQAPDQSLQLPQYQESLEIALRSGDRALELDNLLGLGNLHSYLQEYTQALEYYERLLHLARETKNIPAQIDCLPKLATAYKSIKQYDKALELYRLHLSLIPEVSYGSNLEANMIARANSLESLAHIYQILGEYTPAKATYQACLDFSIHPLPLLQRGNCLIGLGISSDRLGQFKEAIVYYQQALEIFSDHQLGIKYECRYELECQVNIAYVYNSLGQYKESVIFYEKALRLSLKEHNHYFQAKALIGLGNVQNSLGKFVKAIQFYEQAWEISKDFLDPQAIALENLGNVYNTLGQYPEAMELYKKSLAIAKEGGNLEQQARCLNDLGQVLDRLGYYAQALQFYQEWIDLKKAMGDRSANLGSVARDISSNVANSSLTSSKYAQAIEFHQQWIEVKRKMGDRSGEANSLGNLGNAYFALGQYPQAIQAYQHCLEIARTITDRRSEASSLSGLGSAFFILGQYSQAIEFHERSLEISQKIDDLMLQAKTFSNLGKAYYALGQYLQAAQKYLQCLELIQKIGNRQGEANILGDLGNAHYALGKYAQAINFYQQWLNISTEIGDLKQQGNALGGLGNSHNALGQYAKAVELYQQWIEIAQAHSDRRSEANALAGLGNAYNALGEYSRAIEFHQQSLKIQKEHGDRLDKPSWSNLIDTLETLEQKSLAPNPYASIDVESTNQDDSAIQQLLEAGLASPPDLKSKELKQSKRKLENPQTNSKLQPSQPQSSWLSSTFGWLTGNK